MSTRDIERTSAGASSAVGDGEDRARTPGGIPIAFRVLPAAGWRATSDRDALGLHLEYLRLRLLRDYDQLACLEGLTGVEHLPHQIETVRKVLRRFRGRVLLADEVGLGKTIEACLLLREYLLRGLVKRVLIVVPTPLVSQWHEELATKFHLDFSIPPRTSQADRLEYWQQAERVLTSLAFAKSRKRAELVSAAPWDLVIVDEAHHCKNRATQNWQLVNALKRRRLFLLTATPVQNNLLELYNLLTLLEPGHLKTETDFKRQYVRRGNPRDPRNRERLRSLLGEVMIRNTRSLVQLDLPARYAQTMLAQPHGEEAALYAQLNAYLRSRRAPLDKAGTSGIVYGNADDGAGSEADSDVERVALPHSPRPRLPRLLPRSEAPLRNQSRRLGLRPDQAEGRVGDPTYMHSRSEAPGGSASRDAKQSFAEAGSQAELGNQGQGHQGYETQGHGTPGDLPPLGRRQLSALLLAAGSHAEALRQSLENIAGSDPQARPLIGLARRIGRTAKDEQFLNLVRQGRGEKMLVFASFRRTLEHLQELLGQEGVPFTVFSGAESESEKDAAVAAFRDKIPIMLCSESGGEGRNLQFANTLVNFDLPWNPMRIEQRIGRIHRIGQTREVFIFNLCTAGSLEARLLGLLDEKIRMFELVVGEIGSILGNLQGGEQFESLVLDLWLRSHDDAQLDRSFDDLGTSLLDAQEEYLQAKQLDEALFGEEYQ